MKILGLVLAILLALLTGIVIGAREPALTENAERVPGLNDLRIEGRIRKVLAENPELVVEAFQKWQLRQEQARDERTAEALARHREAVFDVAAAPVIGNPDADVTIVEFMDYNCGFCRRALPVIRDLLQDDPGIRVVLRELPVLGAGSEFAAQAALAAERQGMYRELHYALMEADEALDKSRVLAIAEEIGLDMQRLEADMADPALAQAISANRELAGALTIDGTPAFVVGDRLARGYLEPAALLALVQAARSPP